MRRGTLDRSGLRPSAAPRYERGIALVLVLWAAALLSVMAVSFAFSVRTEVRLIGSNGAAVGAGALAEAGIFRAIVGLSLADGALQWQGNGREYSLVFGEGEVKISALAETGKIDLNAASGELLAGLVEAARTTMDTPGVADARQIADAIMDWRDGNDTKRSFGAEDRDYARAGLEFGAGDRPFLAVSELRRVLGVSPELYAAIAPLVTVYSFNPRVDPLLAPRGVLMAVPGLTAEQADDFLAERERELVAADSAARGVRRRLLRTARQMVPKAARYMASGRAAVYTVTAHGTSADGTLAVRQVTVRLTRSKRRPYQILAWRESAAPVPGQGTVQPPKAARARIAPAAMRAS